MFKTDAKFGRKRKSEQSDMAEEIECIHQIHIRYSVTHDMYGTMK